MRIIFFCVFLVVMLKCTFSQNVGINSAGANPDNSAMLDVSSTNRGLLMPRMTTTQRDGIGTPAEGLQIFNTTTKCFEAYVLSAWHTVSCPAACNAPSTPTEGTHVPSQTQIVWNWNSVSNVVGYKYNTTNDYSTAIDNGTSLTHTQTSLTCGTAYTLYVWAYNACGNSSVATLIENTSTCCPSFSDDFSGTDDWTDVNTLNAVNTGTDVIDWDGSRTTTNHATSYDLTSVSNSAWVLRFKLVIDNIGLPNIESSHHIGIMLSSAPGSTDSKTARDCIGMTVHNRNGAGSPIKHFLTMDKDGTAWAQTAWNNLTATPAVGTYYFEIKRTSTTAYTVSRYPDATFTTASESRNETCTATTDGLRYLLIQNDNNGGATSNFNGTIDDIEFCDGVTSF